LFRQCSLPNTCRLTTTSTRQTHTSRANYRPAPALQVGLVKRKKVSNSKWMVQHCNQSLSTVVF
jgi:hypothetical protein